MKLDLSNETDLYDVVCSDGKREVIIAKEVFAHYVDIWVRTLNAIALKEKQGLIFRTAKSGGKETLEFNASLDDDLSIT